MAATTNLASVVPGTVNGRTVHLVYRKGDWLVPACWPGVHMPWSLRVDKCTHHCVKCYGPGGGPK
jgi:hypothetical protein